MASRRCAVHSSPRLATVGGIAAPRTNLTVVARIPAPNLLRCVMPVHKASTGPSAQILVELIVPVRVELKSCLKQRTLQLELVGVREGTA